MKRFCALLMFGVLTCGPVAAQDDDEPMEEITAYGQKTLLNLKYAAQQAEEDFFNRYNELNDIDEFDVFCDDEASTYSRVKRRQCWSPFEREVDEEQAEQAFLTGGRTPVRNEGLIRQKRLQQAEHLKQMVLENPELQTLYTRYGEANIEFETERERRCSDNLLCRDPDRDQDERVEE